MPIVIGENYGAEEPSRLDRVGDTALRQSVLSVMPGLMSKCGLRPYATESARFEPPLPTELAILLGEGVQNEKPMPGLLNYNQKIVGCVGLANGFRTASLFALREAAAGFVGETSRSARYGHLMMVGTDFIDGTHPTNGRHSTTEATYRVYDTGYADLRLDVTNPHPDAAEKYWDSMALDDIWPMSGEDDVAMYNVQIGGRQLQAFSAFVAAQTCECPTH